MAWLMGDSMAMYADRTDMLRRWSTVDTGVSFPTTGGPRDGVHMNTPHIDNYRLTGDISPSGAGFVIGFRFRYNVGGNATDFVTIYDGGTGQCSMKLEASRHITLQSGAGIGEARLITSERSLLPQSWNFIEFKGTIDNSAGVLEVRVNNEVWATISSQDTQRSGAAQWTELHFEGLNSIQTKWADVYILDQSGGVDDDYLGDIMADYKPVDGNGNTANFLGSDADMTNNFELVDDDAPGPDDDSTYIESNTVTDKDDSTVAPTDVASGIVCVQWVSYNRNASVSSGVTGRDYIRSGGTDFEGSDFPTTASYDLITRPNVLDPNTSAAWTVANRDAANAGIKVQSIP